MTNLRARLLASFYAVGHSDAARAPIDHSQTIEFDYGTAANRGDFLFPFSGAIVASATHTYTLGDASREDAFGSAIDAVGLKGVLLINTGTTTLTIGGTNQIAGGGSTPLYAGGLFMVSTPTAAGYTASGGASLGTITVTNISGSTAGAYTLATLGILA